MNLSSLIRRGSVWDQSQIGAFLLECKIPIRLACLNNDHKPIICSLWYEYEGGTLWCATQKSAAIVKYLAQASDVGFEISTEAMPYRGVRGQGKATLLDAQGPEVLLRLIDRYLGDRESAFANWLIKRSGAEVAICIEPDWLTSWDFGKRMRTAG